MILATLALAAQTTWYVDASATPPGLGTQAAPFVRIDDTIANPNVADGDTVLVLPGAYDDEAIDFLGKNLVVRGTGGPAATTIRGVSGASPSQSAIRFVSGETQMATLDGFTIEASGGEPWNPPFPVGASTGGGAVFCRDSSPVLRNLRITAAPIQSADAGGGIALENSAAIISHVEIESIATSWGGALAAIDSSPLITQCHFNACTAFFSGGAIAARNSHLQLSHCSVENCFAFADGGAVDITGGSLLVSDSYFDGNSSTGDGGAVRVAGQAELRRSVFSGNGTKYPGGAVWGADVVKECEFRSNRGELGGALHMGSGVIEDCSFKNNRADTVTANLVAGGAVYATGVVEVTGSTFLRNEIAPLSTFPNATLGGADIYGTAIVDRCTFVDSVSRMGTPSVVAGGTASVVTNSIVVNASAPAFGSATVTFTNVDGGWPGTGNIDQSPRFWDLANDDVHLLPGSPSIDAGSPVSSLDPDGTTADQGALVFDPYHCSADCDPALASTICASNLNSTGDFASLDALGSASVTADRLVLNVTGSPQNTFGFFLASRHPGFTPLGGGSQGILCLGAPVYRFDSDVLTDRGTGVVSYRPRLGSFPQGQAALPGDTWYFQYWFRDFNGGLTSNTSSALRIDFQ